MRGEKHTIIDEKRELMGKKSFLSIERTGILWIGVSDSRTLKIERDNAELLRYCPVGLTGSRKSSVISINQLLVATKYTKL